MSSRAKEIAGQAEQASESSRDGLRSMGDMAQVMDAIEEQTESVAEHIASACSSVCSASALRDCRFPSCSTGRWLVDAGLCPRIPFSDSMEISFSC